MQNLRATREDLIIAQARINELEVKLAATEAYAERLRIWGEALDENIYPPDSNCSCHISPPCSDCVENGGAREAKAGWAEAKETKP